MTGPVPPLPPHHEEVLRERVRALYRGSLLAMAVSLAVAAILVTAHTRAGMSPALLAAWFGALSLVLALRLVNHRQYHRHPQQHLPERWLQRYRLGTLATGLLWGVAGGAFSTFNPDLQVFTLLAVAGIATGAMGSLVNDYPGYRLFVITALTPAVAAAVLQLDYMQLATAGLLLLLMVFLLRSAGRNAQGIDESLRLRFENLGLLQALEREKNNQLEHARTMMNTVLESTPIALWAIDMNARLTYFESQKLIRQTGQPMPATGDNLLAFFDREPQISKDIQRVLTGERFVSEVQLGGHIFEVHHSPMCHPGESQHGAIGVAIDISERKRHENELLRRANYDDLTGLANRNLAMEVISGAFARANRSQAMVALCFLDLDNFKSINDTLGHATGDDLLRQAADRLRECLRASDLAARISSDEFLVVGEEIHRSEDAEALAHKIVARFQPPFVIDGRPLFATTSVGIALYPRDAPDVDQLLQCADTAMYAAKEAGRNNYHFFTEEMHRQAMRHLSLETEIRNALDAGELQLFYQPKVDLARERISGAEVLLRWHSAKLGRVSPQEFIPVAEMAGLMPQIGDWILRKACCEAVEWQDLGVGPVGVAINISPQQFRKTDLLANVTQALIDSRIDVELLELEITESLLMQDSPNVLHTLQALREMGVTLALDDFGTGYSSLSYLRRFPLQVLKIDKSFVEDLEQNSGNQSLVYAIISMARSLQLSTVAEGVESAQQLKFLHAYGVEKIQGYLYSPAVPAKDFRELLLDPTRCGLPAIQTLQEGSPAAKSG